MKLYFVSLFALMAIFFLLIGVRIVVTKKPLLINSRIFFVFMILCFSPQLINFMNLFGTEAGARMGAILYLNPLLYTLLLSFFWIQMKGYIAVGVHDESFRDAIHYSLNKNEMPFEEQLSLIKLTSIGAQLQIAVQSWVGTAQLKLKNSNDKSIIKKIVLVINDYYFENDIDVNNITAVFYILMGIVMLAFSILFMSSKM